MKYFLLLCFIHLWGTGCSTKILNHLAKGTNTIASSLADTKLLQKFLFSHCIEPPQECPNENITFWYTSRSNPDTLTQIKLSDLEDFKNSNGNPWKIIIHGYTKSKDEIPNPELRSAYFQHGDYNIISVDYEPLAKNKCYLQAVRNAPLIANCTAYMIDALIDNNVFESNEYHVIGFSLGAQIAGLIHKYLKHEKPSRITGLDPAAPLFDGYFHDTLNPNSANFVDVIHTNALTKGKLEASGDIDFYVNGGISQPGCMELKKNAFSGCSHNRAPFLFAESINSKKGFWGVPCASYIGFYTGKCNVDDQSQLVLMGEFVPQTKKGFYFLQTTANAPFALGKSNQITNVD